MKLLAIYHAPQECGEPYVMLISLESGQPTELLIFLKDMGILDLVHILIMNLQEKSTQGSIVETIFHK